MKQRNIFITEYDRDRLEELIGVAGDFAGNLRADLELLAEELDRAEIVDSRAVPPAVVTMNSQVVLCDLASGEQRTFTLVFPRDVKEGGVSILAPVGTAVLGYSVGDVVEWAVPSGIRRFKIEALPYQPEAAGDYHL